MAEQVTNTDQVRSANFFMKVVVIGNSGVGKTSILQSLINPDFQIPSSGTKPTIGSDLYTYDLKIEGGAPSGKEAHYAQLQIWDTAGQERFNALGKQLYRGADILVLVYDISDQHSFTMVEHWRYEFMEHLQHGHPHPFPTLLLGNKLDLAEMHQNLRKVPTDKAMHYAEGHDMIFNEVSARTKMNLFPAFQDIALIAMNRVTIPLVYQIDHKFVHPAAYLEEENPQQDQGNGPCSCQLL